MEEFRKTQTIEIVDKQYEKVTFDGDTRKVKSGVLVQNKGDSSDQWVIPTKVFKETYEPVKNADYTILTPEQRDIIRIKLYNYLHNLMTMVALGKNKSEDIAKEFFEQQALVGEKYKTFEEKITFIESLIDETSNGFIKETTFVDRLKKECSELIIKKVALQNFFATKIFYKLEMEDKDLLYEQDRLMSRYIQILGKRMARAKITDFIKGESNEEK